MTTKKRPPTKTSVGALPPNPTTDKQARENRAGLPPDHPLYEPAVPQLMVPPVVAKLTRLRN